MVDHENVHGAPPCIEFETEFVKSRKDGGRIRIVYCSPATELSLVCVCQLDLAHFDTLIWPPSKADSSLALLRFW